MKVALINVSLLTVAGLLGGCQWAPLASEQRVHTLSSTVTPVDSQADEASTITLGSGDELGQAMFQHYSRLVRAEKEAEHGHDPTLVQSQ